MRLITQLTKIQLQENLIRMKQISLESVKRKRRFYLLAKGFLEDFEKFSKVLNEFSYSQKFNVINQNSKIYKKKNEITILFDSFSIVLLQENNELYIYCIAEYKLKW